MNNKIIQKLHIDWSKVEKYSYLWHIPALHNMENLEFTKNITFFVGENGSGKSTLLEAIAVAYGFNPEGGTINYSFSTYEDVSELHRAKMAEEGSQFIIVTHSPILLGIPNAEILSFDDGEIHPCAYEDTESYQVTKMFLMHREKMLEGLLGGVRAGRNAW